MLRRKVAIGMLMVFFAGTLIPLFSVSAYPIVPEPYRPNPELVKPEDYKPNPEIPKVGPVKSTGSNKSSDDGGIDWTSYGNVGLYTQALWNAIGDWTPQFMFSGLQGLKHRYTSDGKYIIFYGRRAHQSLLEKIFPGVSHYFGNIVGRQGIKGTRYRVDNPTVKAYLEKINRYNFDKAGDVSKWKFILNGMKAEAKTSFKESLLIFSKDAKSASWAKGAGPLGIALTGVFTALEFAEDENGAKKHGWLSTEFASALVTDIGLGAACAVAGSALAGLGAAAFAAVAGVAVPALAVTAIGVGFSIGIGFLIENTEVGKAIKDGIKNGINWAMEGAVNLTKNVANWTKDKLSEAKDWVSEKVGGVVSWVGGLFD